MEEPGRLMLTLITCTGGRPEAFALCERWMIRQMYRGPVQWIVVDDGPEPTPVTCRQIVVRPQPLWQPGQNTLARNILAALPLVQGDRIAFIEDDDWYGRNYLTLLMDALDRTPVAGEVPARYYNVRTRQHTEPGNTGHASLCQTGIRASHLQMVWTACETGPQWIDKAIWRNASSVWLYPNAQSVGIKGLPGREGLGIGHRPRASWPADPEMKVLREWIGSDASVYAPFYGG